MTDKPTPDKADEPDRHADQGKGAESGNAAQAAESTAAVLNAGTASRSRSPLITAIEIENFKAIGRPMRVDLRPITLLFGNNSAGKSTIIQALCYAHEILSHRNVDAHKTELGGDQIDLGGFRQFVHGQNIERSVRLRFELNLDGRDIRPVMQPDDTSLAPYELSELDVDDAKSGRLTLCVRWDESAKKATVDSYDVEINGDFVGRLESATTAGNAVLLANLLHPLIERPDTAETDAGREEGSWRRCRLNLAQQSAVPLWDRLLRTHRLPTKYVAPELSREFGEAGKSRDIPRFDKVFREISSTELEAREKFTYQFSALLVAVGQLLREELGKIRYLGPLRDVHPHDDVASGRSDASRWAGGSAAWTLLNDDARRNSDLVRDTSNWLSCKDRLDTGYKLQTRSVVELPGDEPLVARILDSKQREKEGGDSKLSDPEAAESPGDIVRAADPSLVDALVDRIRNAVRKRVRLVSMRIDQPVRTFDIGVGVSQILPVVVAALDPLRPGVTAIEQPELHVHPKMQVELGDLFAQGVGQGGIFLLETHSEHLLLRIMRRMRQTSDGTLPAGAPMLRPEDVNVLLVEPDGAETLVREMPLNESGELVKAWPGGFFEEDMREIFDIREGS